ncbi:DNA mismatch repair protein MutS [Coprothermobacteraceae bacterium]|nr:DNA mismatch repair protein MutS [Coprothermobacteraceae bacterium]
MSNKEFTPMGAQYWKMKQEVGDDVLLAFRLGDFYEFFYDDAVKAAEALQIVLTGREFGKGNRVPMCGFPHHAFDGYVAKLVSQGFKVAVCEQVEDPRKAKGLVKRDIIRVYTPGTFAEGTPEHVWLAVLRAKRQTIEVMFVDVSTGDFMYQSFPLLVSEGAVQDYFYTFSPREVLVVDSSADHPILKRLISKLQDIPITVVPDAPRLDEVAGDYLRQLRAGAGLSLRERKEQTLFMPPETVRGLELVFNPVTNSKKGTLLELLDETLTPMGHRELHRRLISPWAQLDRISRHLDLVEYLVLHPSALEEIRASLRGIADIERIVHSLEGSGQLKVKSLLDLREGLRRYFKLQREPISAELDAENPDISDVLSWLEEALTGEDDEVGSGRVIAPAWNGEFAQVVQFVRETQKWLTEFEAQEREKTGIRTLKVGYNDTFGYYIEISKGQAKNAPEHYIKRQTLVNAERFVTKELLEFEARIQQATEEIAEKERVLFEQLLGQVRVKSEQIKKAAHWLAYLDVAAALAVAARKFNWTKPKVVSERRLLIRHGRHPVVEWYSDTPFIPNSLEMAHGIRTALVTGPNMAGKSTFLRQTAIIALLAHMGSFVPAEYAEVPLLTKIFARMGAADEIIYGKSTFMVEMTQVARILKESDESTLVVMDEIGRGTAVADGLAIAWAVVKDLALRKSKPFAMISTHYPEIAELSQNLPVLFLSARVEESKDGIRFLYRMEPGISDKAYGLEVAALSGVPDSVLSEARKLFEKLNSQERFWNVEDRQLRLFS